MGKNPAFQFYPKDWLSDIELQSCSLAARGLWISLLCLMHFSQKYGYLLLNGCKPDVKMLAKLLHIDNRIAANRLQELIQKGVARVDENGVIYSKRMLEDQRLREIRREAGLKGGNPSLLKQQDNQEVNQDGYPSCTPPPSPSPSPSPKNSISSEPKGSKPIITFNAEREEFEGIMEELKDRWKQAYPVVNIEPEIKKAAEWAVNNPSKHKKNWRRFLANWFSRVQERGGTQGSEGDPEEEFKPAYIKRENGKLVPLSDYLKEIQ